MPRSCAFADASPGPVAALQAASGVSLGDDHRSFGQHSGILSMQGGMRCVGTALMGCEGQGLQDVAVVRQQSCLHANEPARQIQLLPC